MYTLLTMRKESRIRPRGPEKLAVFLKTPESIHSRYIVSSHISYVTPVFWDPERSPNLFQSSVVSSNSRSFFAFLVSQVLTDSTFPSCSMAAHPAHIHSALCPNCPSRRRHEPGKSTPGSCRDRCNHRVLGLGSVKENVEGQMNWLGDSNKQGVQSGLQNGRIKRFSKANTS